MSIDVNIINIHIMISNQNINFKIKCNRKKFTYGVIISNSKKNYYLLNKLLDSKVKLDHSVSVKKMY